MSDLQAAGLAWLLYQNYLTQLGSGEYQKRLRTSDTDFFDQNRSGTVEEILDFGRMGSSSFSRTVLEGDLLFIEYSKGRGQIKLDNPTNVQLFPHPYAHAKV